MSLYTKIIDLQKLDEGWTRARKNKPAAGVDGITYEQFEVDRKGELKKLQLELQEHTYQTLPVKQVNVYKGEKVRTIALYSMRDKAVQQSIANELNRIFDRQFSSQTYAYRNDKSAIVAIGEINERIMSGTYMYFLKVDISHFFDNILWSDLKEFLYNSIEEEDVIELIHQNACAPWLDETTGELMPKEIGIHQGSGIAPILSNIYLMEFDRWLTSLDIYFVRYSDDMIILGNNHDRLLTILQEIKLRLGELGLKINETKSVIGELAEGFNFLGYYFDINGKAIPAKAEANLNDRLEMMWLTSSDIGIEDKIKKTLEIVGGWEQYYREERQISSIFEFVAIVYAKGTDEEWHPKLAELRSVVENIYLDIADYLANFWRRYKMWECELREYEQYYKLPVSSQCNMEDNKVRPLVHELLHSYRQYIIREDYDIAIEIMQSYTDLRLYPQAEYWQDYATKLKKRQELSFNAVLRLTGDENDISFRPDTASKMIHTFIGREDLYAADTIDEKGSRKVETELRPVTEHTIKEHLMGRTTVDTYIQRPNSTIRFMVIDVDLPKHILIRTGRDSEEFRTHMQKVLDVATCIRRELSHLGLNGYIEFSGCRGYHVWLFMNEWIPTRYANLLSEIIDRKIPRDDNISIEFFPNKTRIKGGKYGQAIKLPYGIHSKTGERSFFLDEGGNPIMDVDSMIDAIAKTSLADIKKVIASFAGTQDKIEQKKVDTDISAYGDVDPGIREVLMNCNLLRYLCLKSVKTGYLTHFERLTVLYVFGHLGVEGQEFVHKVMSFTINYKHQVTEHFIRKMPEKPVSCVKLREQYKQLTAESGCSCVFKRNKNCYPSPVLHAIALSNDLQGEVTLPTSRSMTKEKESMVKAELNVHSSVEQLAARIVEAKKQKRLIDKTIAKTEKELEKIFDSQGVDCMEIQMGMLVRRKKDDGCEWLIEI